MPGQYHDRETGLYYNRHRYYDPKIGSYINQDPIGLTGGINSFAYVNGNPVSYSDPKGLEMSINPPTIRWPSPVTPARPGMGALIGGMCGRVLGIGLGLLLYSSDAGGGCADAPYDPGCPKQNDNSCQIQWEEDTAWCDNNYKGRANIACHTWAQEELWRCRSGSPRQLFRL